MRHNPINRWCAETTVAAFFLSVALGGAAAEVTDFEFAGGTPYASPGFIIQAENPGPTVLCIAGVARSDSVSPGYLESLRDVELHAGKLIVVPGYSVPGGERRGIRRAFPREHGAEIPLDSARALWEALQELEVQYLIEIGRGMRNIRTETRNRNDYGNTIFFGSTGESRSLVDACVRSVNYLVENPHHRWRRIARPVPGLLVRAASDELAIHTLRIFPSTQLDADGARREQVLEIIHAALRHLGMITN